jgi:CDP-diacylglycerol--serine O-phosphatidyltransferase
MTGLGLGADGGSGTGEPTGTRLKLLGPLGRARAERRQRQHRRLRRGVYLLPSAFTLANLFCGYACIVYAMRREWEVAAPFIGVAIVLDMLDGRIARLTGTTSDFGVQFDSLADVVSFGVAPAILTFTWGLEPLGRLGWAAGFIYVTAAATRLARFNIQHVTDKRYFVGMPSPAAGGILAATVYAYPAGLQWYGFALPVLLVVLLPAFLMVSTIRFRSFKAVDLQARRSYKVLLALAVVVAVITTPPPRLALVALAYLYLVSAFIELIVTRIRRRGQQEAAAGAPPTSATPPT